MLEEQLEKFGLSEKEAKTYLSLLELGESPATDIAKKADVNRSTAYVVLEALEKKGLVSNIQSAGKQTFRAAPPEKLEFLAEEMLKKHEEIYSAVRSAIPELKGIHAHEPYQPKIYVHEGKDGIIELFEDTFNSEEKVMRVFSSVSQFENILPKTYFPNYVRRRIKADIKMYGIHPKSTFTKLMRKLLPEAKTETTLIPANNFNFDVDLAIYDDNIAYMTEKRGGYGIRIKDKDMADSMKSIFDLALAEAKRLEKNN